MCSSQTQPRVTLNSSLPVTKMPDPRKWRGMLQNAQDLLLHTVKVGTSPVVQGLRLHTRNAGGLGWIPGWGTRSHTLQLRDHMLQLKEKEKILHTAMKIMLCSSRGIPFSLKNEGSSDICYSNIYDP